MGISIFNIKIFINLGDILSYTRIFEYLWINKYACINNNSVCDIACGNGFWSNLISRKSSFFTGIDLNRERITQANLKYHKPNTSFLVADAQEIPLKTNSQDRIVSFCALEHFPSDIKALGEMRRIIRDEGVLAMSVDSMSLKYLSQDFLEYHKKKYYGHNYYTVDELSEKLNKAGLRIEEYKYLTTTLFSSLVLRMAAKHRRLFQFFFPILFPLTVVSDKVFGKNDRGHKLVIKAKVDT